MLRSSLPLASLLLSLVSLPAMANHKADGTTIKVDASQVEIVQKFSRQARKVAGTWYPRIIKSLGADQTKLPKQISIIIDLEADGVAATSGDEIRVSARYVCKHPNDLGMIVHELTHVVQSYPNYDPVWLVEGVADYVRFYVYEPITLRPHPDPTKVSYSDSYRTTASFLNYVATHYDKELVRKIDKALKEGAYTSELFQKTTGKNLNQLNAEWLVALATEKKP